MHRRPSIVVQEVPYCEDVANVFAAFSHLPWAVFLDSGRPYSTYGRYDIFSAYPKKAFSATHDRVYVSDGLNVQAMVGEPFSLLAQEVQSTQYDNPDLPFSGGAIGYFSYDLGRRIERIPAIAQDDINMPLLAVGMYHWAYVADHKNQSATLVGNMAEPVVRLNWDDIVQKVQAAPVQRQKEQYRATTAITSNMCEQEYKKKFRRVKDYIQAGDCYQVNLAQRFNTKVSGDPWQGYLQMRDINPSPFSAYLNFADFQILSASPERFLQVRNRVVETKPIKGTRPRLANEREDQALRNELRNSIKDRAENVMIVDLLRNDLSKCCEPNSVKVPELFALESFPTVHHLVSTITGVLPQNVSPLKLLRACFPGGSITGAPKIRAMEIIEELEPHRRGLYCGSIGYIGFNGDMDTNIAIRTLIQKDQNVYFYAGGGLVWDSNADAEYQETFDKAAAMFKLLQGE